MRCQRVPVTTYGVERRMVTVVQYVPECQMVNQQVAARLLAATSPQVCSQSSCQPSGCTDGGSPCSGTGAPPSPPPPRGAAPAGVRPGPGPAQPRPRLRLPAGPAARLLRPGAPQPSTAQGQPCFPGQGQQCCSEAPQQVCRQVPRRVPLWRWDPCTTILQECHRAKRDMEGRVPEHHREASRLREYVENNRN